MSRSDTDPDLIDAMRPKYMLGREVSFSGGGGQVLVGRIARSTQVIRGSNTLVVTYDINSSGRTFHDVPEEQIFRASKR